MIRRESSIFVTAILACYIFGSTARDFAKYNTGAATAVAAVAAAETARYRVMGYKFPV